MTPPTVAPSSWPAPCRSRARIAALEAQQRDIEAALSHLSEGCAAIEARLETMQPDLLPRSREFGQAETRLAGEPA